jgi:MFS family permease
LGLLVSQLALAGHDRLCIALGGYGVKGPFWALVSDWISPANKAAAIAAVNSLANVSGFVAPSLFGFIKDQTGSFALGLLPMIVLALIDAAAVLLMSRKKLPGEVSGFRQPSVPMAPTWGPSSD